MISHSFSREHPLQNTTESANPEKLSMRQKLVYGFGDTGFSLTGTIVAASFAIFI
jgi:Na+/melibiose symporter-like transporter